MQVPRDDGENSQTATKGVQRKRVAALIPVTRGRVSGLLYEGGDVGDGVGDVRRSNTDLSFV